jgi:hypothetical protein
MKHTLKVQLKQFSSFVVADTGDFRKHPQISGRATATLPISSSKSRRDAGVSRSRARVLREVKRATQPASQHVTSHWNNSFARRVSAPNFKIVTNRVSTE